MEQTVRSCFFVLVVTVFVVLLNPSSSFSIEPEDADSVVNMVQWRAEDGGNNHWYAVFPYSMDWYLSSYFAFTLKRNGRYGHLACIGSKEENQFIVNQVLGNLPASDIEKLYWIGGQENGGQFRWVSLESFDYHDWAADYPQKFDRESGMAMLGAIADSNEGIAGQWINVIRAPKDEAGRKALAVVEWDYQTYPQDTLLNLIQWTKADGGNDHWYAVMPQMLSWLASDSLARILRFRGHRGYLATLTSAEESNFVCDHVLKGIRQPAFVDQLWVGGVDVAGLWTWVTNEPFIYTNWARGKLDNVGIETVMSVWGWGNANDSRRIPGTWNNSMPHRIGAFGVVEFGGLLNDSLVPTDRWVNLYCQTPTIDGRPLAPGSVVCAYDPDGVLCGIDSVRVDGSFGFLIVYGDDLSSAADEGAMPGDKISLVIDNIKVVTDSTLVWTSNGDILKVQHDLRSPQPENSPVRNKTD